MGQLPSANENRKPLQMRSLTVGMGNLLVSADADAEIVTYSLGSCIGLVIYDPVAKVGGLLHAMLPDSSANPERATKQPGMFVDFGIAALFQSLYSIGGQKQRIIAKLAGGGDFLDERKIFRIGERNVEAVRYILKEYNVPIVASDTGHQVSRTMRLILSNGEVQVRSPSRPTLIL